MSIHDIAAATGNKNGSDSRVHCWHGVHVHDDPACRQTVLDSLVRQVRSQPHTPVFSQPGPRGELQTLTFAQLDTLSSAGAAWLHDAAGARSGTPLAVVPANDLQSVVLIFAAIRLAAPIALLDPQAPPARHAALLDSLGIGLTVRTMSDSAGIDHRVFPALADLPVRSGPEGHPAPHADVFYIATSGSTAASKIVAQTHRGSTANALGVSAHHGLCAGDRFLGCLPIHHVNGLHFSVMAAVFCGYHTLLAPGFDPFHYPRLLEAFQPHLASVVPSLLNALQATWKTRNPPAAMRYFVSAAAPLSKVIAQMSWERWKLRVLQGYGLTETINFTTTLPRALTQADYARWMLDADIPTIGSAISGNDIEFLGPDSQAVPLGAIGELCVRGHNVMDRYVGNPYETAHAFRDGWFHTGDLGHWTGDAQHDPKFAVITGREKNIAKVRGESVSLEEMERHLLEMMGVRDAACAAVPDTVTGESIVAAIAAPMDLSDTAVLSHLRAVFPQVALPRRIVRMDDIPRSPTGKLLRPQLRALLDAASANERSP